MHPVIIQTVAAARSRDMQAHAAAARRAREIRRSRRAQQARPWWPFLHVPGAGRGPDSLPALRPLRGPRAA